MIKDTSAQDTTLSHKGKRPTKKLTIALGLLALGALLYFAFSGGHAQRSINKSQVQLATVERGDLVRDVTASGRIVAARAPQVYSPAVGFVDLLVQPGDRVRQGQVIASITSPELTNNLKQQESELARRVDALENKKLDVRRQSLALTKALDMAQVELTAAQREFRRARQSIDKDLISQIDYEQATDELARARLAFNHAEQEVSIGKDTLAFELKGAQSQVTRQQLVVDELRRRVNELQILASVNGVVGNHLVQQRAAVTQSQALMTLVDLSAFEAELQVPESYANELGLGMQVALKIGAQEVSGELSAISPEVNNREVTTRVRFDQQALGNIRQNQRLSARIFLENKANVLMVKRGAFLNHGGNQAYLVKGDVAEKISIAIGASSMAAIELTRGVSAGDVLIISSYDTFDDSQQLLLR